MDSSLGDTLAHIYNEMSDFKKEKTGRVPDVIFAVDAIKGLPEIARKKFGAKRAFLITDAGLTRAGLTDLVSQILEQGGLKVMVYDKVVANPTVAVIHAGADVLRALVVGTGQDSATVVVTLGGGSSMDAGKAIAMLAAQPKGASILDFARTPCLNSERNALDFNSLRPKARPRGTLPIIAVPTTSGTASETNGAAVISGTIAGQCCYLNSHHAHRLPMTG